MGSKTTDAFLVRDIDIPLRRLMGIINEECRGIEPGITAAWASGAALVMQCSRTVAGRRKKIWLRIAPGFVGSFRSSKIW